MGNKEQLITDIATKTKQLSDWDKGVLDGLTMMVMDDAFEDDISLVHRVYKDMLTSDNFTANEKVSLAFLEDRIVDFYETTIKAITIEVFEMLAEESSTPSKKPTCVYLYKPEKRDDEQ